MVWKIQWIRMDGRLFGRIYNPAHVQTVDRNALYRVARSFPDKADKDRLSRFMTQQRRLIKRSRKDKKAAHMAASKHKRRVREDQRSWKNYRHRQYRLTSNGVQIINGA